MKILIVYQHYWPEYFRITDIAETLVKTGNKVTVLCGLPNYPDGYVLKEYKSGKNRRQVHNGVKIVRAKEIGRRNNLLFRFLNYWSYPFFAKKMINQLDDDFDVVFVPMTSPIMMAEPGLLYAKKHHKKVVMYEMDLWPESLLAGGVKKGSFLYNHYKKVSSKIYSRCDKILVSTKEHIQYIKELPNCSSLDIDYLPQYAETIFEQSNYENEDNKTIDLMFAGNIGKAQSIGTIIRTAALLKSDTRFKFHIVGSGSEFENVKKLAEELKTDNVIFYGNRPIDEMPSLYRLADVMLVTLENKDYANMTIPGKVQSYMAAGKPVIGAINGACSNFITNNEIGYTCASGDFEALANIIKHLDSNVISDIGKRAKEIYLKKYKKDIFINKLLNELKKYSN